ncbi:MAG: phosphoribosylglycinamide formyltransferase [Deltaproteobacteria bacterium]|nr:phosphoribosylglycinamide formyltransferase [Deltaproteobacteria bacterium]
MTLDLAVLVSGSGTNLQAILDAIARGELDARVRLVISNVPGVKALSRAEAAGVPTLVVPHKQFPTRDAFDAHLVERVREAVGDRGVVVLAGFMRILTATFLDAFPRRVINIHPSLLPAFPGVDAQKQAVEKGVRITGCTVHLVDAGTDTGPILGQAAVPVLDDDDRDTLAARILVQEHRLLPGVLQWIAEGRLRFDDRGRPRFDGVVPVYWPA